MVKAIDWSIKNETFNKSHTCNQVQDLDVLCDQLEKTLFWKQLEGYFMTRLKWMCVSEHLRKVSVSLKTVEASRYKFCLLVLRHEENKIGMPSDFFLKSWGMYRKKIFSMHEMTGKTKTISMQKCMCSLYLHICIVSFVYVSIFILVCDRKAGTYMVR